MFLLLAWKAYTRTHTHTHNDHLLLLLVSVVVVLELSCCLLVALANSRLIARKRDKRLIGNAGHHGGAPDKTRATCACSLDSRETLAAAAAAASLPMAPQRIINVRLANSGDRRTVWLLAATAAAAAFFVVFAYANANNKHNQAQEKLAKSLLFMSPSCRCVRLSLSLSHSHFAVVIFSLCLCLYLKLALIQLKLNDRFSCRLGCCRTEAKTTKKKRLKV